MSLSDRLEEDTRRYRAAERASQEALVSLTALRREAEEIRQALRIWRTTSSMAGPLVWFCAGCLFGALVTIWFGR